MTRQIRRLEDMGLVRRGASPEDGRGVLASHITDQGRAAVAAAMVTYAGAVRQRFSAPLSRPQISAIRGQLRASERRGENRWLLPGRVGRP